MEMLEKGRRLHASVTAAALYGPASADGKAPWRVSPEPLFLSPGMKEDLDSLGPLLAAFYTACNKLYYDSVRGLAEPWIAEYCDLGKPSEIVELGRLKRFRSCLPNVIRPDLILTGDGYFLCELDSIPGGMGITSMLHDLYAATVPGQEPSVLLQELLGAMGAHGRTAIVVSSESADYFEEMSRLAAGGRRCGLDVYTVRPEEIRVHDDGLYLPEGRIDDLYRFFELFDLPNVPQGGEMMAAACRGQVRLTPPPKAFLEEKLWLALLHHPLLEGYWRGALGEAGSARLWSIVPQGWVVDGRKVPPHALIPGLTLAGRPVSDWLELGGASQKERRLVLKPSGFSPLAWGSHGLRIGHDMSGADWGQALSEAVAGWQTAPYVLQRFLQGSRSSFSYYEPHDDSLRTMEARVRLCPYYFSDGAGTKLSGLLATACPADKKAIHGMPQAVMVPAFFRAS